ncbi:MAG: hypothetical protein JWP12_1080 [Bacteroidetes bacterium]|nr:hypothetical protein [Bacteroidota bacterium]
MVPTTFLNEKKFIGSLVYLFIGVLTRAKCN